MGIRHDYKQALGGSPGAAGRRWLLFAFGLSLPLLAAALMVVGKPTPSANNPPPQIAFGPIQNLPLAIPPPEPRLAEPSAPPEVSGAPLDLVVASGDTLELLFRRNDLSLTDLAVIVALPEVGDRLKLLKPGDRLAIAHNDGQILSLRRELDESRTLFIARSDDGFQAALLERQIDTRTAGAHGVIQTSLFEAGTAAGISDKVTMDMAGVFQWDIDFVQDVRASDEFTVIYEEVWRDGVKLRDGEVVAAEFVNQGKSYRAARYRDGTGHTDYFTPDGHSVRKAFIRAPVDFKRISSSFNPNRRHPMLNTIRAHRGVDYAAPIGTPVWAAGDGKVTFRGVQGGYGNTIVLQHGGNITTLYGHMSRFASLRVGGRVKQGDIIGYVGKSGLATGPHLHYEYRVNGVHRNPRTVTLPPAEPVPAEFHDDFGTVTATLWRQLDLYQQTAVTAAAID